MDEPTRGIDIGAKGEIQALVNELAKDGLGVLMISSELEELVEGSSRVLVMRDGQCVAELRGKEISQDNIIHAIGEDTIQNPNPGVRMKEEQKQKQASEEMKSVKRVLRLYSGFCVSLTPSSWRFLSDATKATARGKASSGPLTHRRRARRLPVSAARRNMTHPNFVTLSLPTSAAVAPTVLVAVADAGHRYRRHNLSVGL